jgi:hypothetical protein
MSEGGFRQEWQIHYDAVRLICAKYGKNDSSGTHDYWVSDENWGGVTQRIIVYSPRFLRPRLVRELISYLRTNKHFGVMIEVILDLTVDGRKLPPMMGLVIDVEDAAEHWDLAAIRKEVGQDFYTD